MYHLKRMWDISDVVMSAMASQITGILIVYSKVCSGEDKKTKTKLPVTGLCEVDGLVAGEFPAQRASNAEFFLRILQTYE